MRAATLPSSLLIGSVPAVAVYLTSRPSSRMVCGVCDVFSSAAPAVCCATTGTADTAISSTTVLNRLSMRLFSWGCRPAQLRPAGPDDTANWDAADAVKGS